MNIQTAGTNWENSSLKEQCAKFVINHWQTAQVVQKRKNLPDAVKDYLIGVILKTQTAVSDPYLEDLANSQTTHLHVISSGNGLAQIPQLFPQLKKLEITMTDASFDASFPKRFDPTILADLDLFKKLKILKIHHKLHDSKHHKFLPILKEGVIVEGIDKKESDFLSIGLYRWLVSDYRKLDIVETCLEKGQWLSVNVDMFFSIFAYLKKGRREEIAKIILNKQPKICCICTLELGQNTFLHELFKYTTVSLIKHIVAADLSEVNLNPLNNKKQTPLDAFNRSSLKLDPLGTEFGLLKEELIAKGFKTAAELEKSN